MALGMLVMVGYVTLLLAAMFVPSGAVNEAMRVVVRMVP